MDNRVVQPVFEYFTLKPGLGQCQRLAAERADSGLFLSLVKQVGLLGGAAGLVVHVPPFGTKAADGLWRVTDSGCGEADAVVAHTFRL